MSYLQLVNFPLAYNADVSSMRIKKYCKLLHDNTEIDDKCD